MTDRAADPSDDGAAAPAPAPGRGSRLDGSLPPLALSRQELDRVAHRRSDDAWLTSRWADPRTRVLAVEDGRVRLATSEPPRLALQAPADVPAAAERILLGVDADGVAYFAVLSAPSDGAATAGLREVGVRLDDREAGLLVHAVALSNWHATHRHCARCGAVTAVAAAGHLRRCPDDGSEHYPRTDPAVIMTVVDSDDRLLLGRSAQWPEARFSTLAGFVEPGESLEEAVRREVLEEVGVRIGRVDYLGSQPWPFPSSLMLGFRACATTTDVVVDGVEVAEARWFDRAGLADGVRSGRVGLSPRISIARALIEHWYGGELPDGPARRGA